MGAFVEIQFAIEDEEYPYFDCKLDIYNLIINELTRVLQKSTFSFIVQKVAISEDKTRCDFEIELTVPENSMRLFDEDRKLLADTCQVFEDFVTAHLMEKQGEDNQKFSQEFYNLFDRQLPQFLKDNCLPKQGEQASCTMFQGEGENTKGAVSLQEREQKKPVSLRRRTF